MDADKHVCELVFKGRSASFANMTWCALILAWECIHPVNSLFYMRQDTDNPWWKQTAIDLWDNQFLFWSIIGGFVSVSQLSTFLSLMTRCSCMVPLDTNGV